MQEKFYKICPKSQNLSDAGEGTLAFYNCFHFNWLKVKGTFFSIGE
jgi:hypothetical protein